MTMKEFGDLKRGDIVRHRISEGSYVVDSHYGSRVTAVRTVDLTNPEEWEVVKRRRIRSSPKK